ncbi:MAG: dihydroorotate dehydrogenase [Candidatus Hermodarchaeota archaeon]
MSAIKALQVEITGIIFKNPFFLASGIFGATLPMIHRVIQAGAGGIITKSTGIEPREGYNNPTVIALDNYSMLNAVGLSNIGVSALADELKDQQFSAPVFASIFGSSADEIASIIRVLNPRCISGFEINLSCPHGGIYGAALGSDADMVHSVISSIVDETDKPLWVKLTPNVTNIVQIARAAEDAGASALVAINTLKAMAIDIRTRCPILSNKIGGLSGAAIHPVAVRCVYDLYRNISIPIIGVGGVITWEDAVEFMLAGAQAVQVGTALNSKDPEVLFPEFCSGLQTFLKEEGFQNVRDLLGLAHEEPSS